MDSAVAGIGARVKAARERRGLSREALAFHSGLSWSAVAQVETGRRTNVRPDTLSALAAVLEVTVDYLVHGGGPQPTLLDHHALLYGSDEEFQSTAGGFLREGLELGEPTLAVTSPGNIELLRDELGSGGKAVQFAEATDWYASPVAALAAYKRFLDTQLETGATWARIVGEVVWVGRSAAEVRRWTTYESLLNLMFASTAVAFVCPYDQRSLPPRIVGQACRTHTHTVDQGGVTVCDDYTDPGTFVLGS
jgi:transcriptional regulator with XRE-family HTH domain